MYVKNELWDGEILKTKIFDYRNAIKWLPPRVVFRGVGCMQSKLDVNKFEIGVSMLLVIHSLLRASNSLVF